MRNYGRTPILQALALVPDPDSTGGFGGEIWFLSDPY